jgi:hypothetical protein
MRTRTAILLVSIALVRADIATTAAYECPEGTAQLRGIETLDPAKNTLKESAQWCARPDGTRHGRWMSWHENDRVSSKGEFRDGEMDGWWVFWYPNGVRKFELRYTSGWQDGDSLEWDELGNPIGHEEPQPDVQAADSEEVPAPLPTQAPRSREARPDPDQPTAATPRSEAKAATRDAARSKSEPAPPPPRSRSRSTSRGSLREKHKKFLLQWTLEKLQKQAKNAPTDRERTVKLLHQAASCLRDLDRSDEAEEYEERARQLETSGASPNGIP